MLSNTNSPIRPKASSAAVMRTPPRPVASVPLQAPQRYLKNIVKHFQNSGDTWHLMTTVPENFYAKCEELKAFLSTHSKLLKKASNQTYDQLADLLYNLLFGDSGIYYTVTNRDLPNLSKYAIHQAHSLICETKESTKLGNTDHRKKVTATLNGVEKIWFEFDKLKLQCHTKDSLRNRSKNKTKNQISGSSIFNAEDIEPCNLDIHNILHEFSEYLKAQHICIFSAINYIMDSELSQSSTAAPPELSPPTELIITWHTSGLKELTPVKMDTPVAHAIANHPIRKNADGKDNPEALKRHKLATDRIDQSQHNTAPAIPAALLFSTPATALAQQVEAVAVSTNNNSPKFRVLDFSAS